MTMTFRFRGAGTPQQQLPNGWISWMASERSPSRDAVTFTFPGILDPNHLNGIGPLWLLAHLPMTAPGSPGALDMTGGRIEIDAKLSADFDARGYQWSPWFCRNYTSGTSPMNPSQSTNWAMHSVNFFDQLNSSTFATAAADISSDPADWTYAGMDQTYLGDLIAGKYAAFPVADTIANVNETLHLPVFGLERVDQPPKGSIEIREIRVTCANTPTPPYNLAAALGLSGASQYRALGALAGDATAKSLYGRMLANGTIGGVYLPDFQDSAAAVAMLDTIKTTDPAAAVTLAILLAQGDGVVRDMTAARALFASWPNYPEARHRLGLMKLNGLGGAVDLSGAFSDIEWAANHSANGVVQAVAMATAGRSYFLGRGSAVNYQWAYIWLERAKLYPAYFSDMTLLNANAEAARLALIAAGGDPVGTKNYFTNPPVWNGPIAV